MARIAAVLKALGRLVAREQKRYHSVGGNNLLLVLYFLGPAGMFVMVLAAAALLVPLSSSPAAKIPEERRHLWPLTPAEWLAVRAGSLVLTPVAWVALLLVLFSKGRAAALQLAAAAVAVQGVKLLLARVPRVNLLRWIPALPGTMGQLMRKNLREMLCVLDTWIAALLAASGVAFRLLRPAAEPEFRPMVAMLVVIILSTYAQCLFGLEARSGFTRYRMLPISGWRILLAKDMAFMAVALALTAGLDPMSGLAAALAVLAVGHHHSVRQPVAQEKWGFVHGALLPSGLTQVVAAFAASNLMRQDARFFAIAVVGWAVSVGFYGWWWGRGEEE